VLSRVDLASINKALNSTKVKTVKVFTFWFFSKIIGIHIGSYSSFGSNNNVKGDFVQQRDFCSSSTEKKVAARHTALCVWRCRG